MGSASRDVLLDGWRSAHAISDAVALSGKSEYDGGPLGLEVALVPFSDERLGQHYGKRIPGCAVGWPAFSTRDK